MAPAPEPFSPEWLELDRLLSSLVRRLQTLMHPTDREAVQALVDRNDFAGACASIGTMLKRRGTPVPAELIADLKSACEKLGVAMPELPVAKGKP